MLQIHTITRLTTLLIKLYGVSISLIVKLVKFLLCVHFRKDTKEVLLNKQGNKLLDKQALIEFDLGLVCPIRVDM